MKQKSIGIALSGGGAKGIAHIGVLAALNELDIYPSHVSGSSAGALVGAFYCAGIAPKELKDISMGHSFSKVFRFGSINMGLTDHNYMRELLLEHIGDIDLQDLQIPLSVGVTNINKGVFETKASGNLMTIVTASCSIPMLFKPVRIGEDLYVDGGVMNNLPVEPLLESCDDVIGISVCQHAYKEPAEGIREIAMRTFQLGVWNTMESRMAKCAIALDLAETATYGLFDFEHGSELYNIGYRAVMEHKDSFLELAEGKWSLSQIFK